MAGRPRRRENGPETPLSREEFARQVREALTRLYDVPYLQNHRLAHVAPAAGGEAVGKVLQRALREAIESLRPGEAPSGGPRAGRSYDLLRLRFHEGLTVDDVCERLGISTREYYREYPKGLEAVTSVLWERWHLGEEQRLPTTMSPPPTPSPPRKAFRLTQPLSSFVGRESELARIRDLLRQARLVTLIGPPGTGKSRLALAAAPLVADSFPDGVVFVPLGAVREATSVVPAIAHALGLETLPGIAIEERLRDGLRDRRILLILDNLEQVVAAGPALVELLSDCPEVHALVTSRIRLNLRGERLLPVPPLAVPETIPSTLDSAAAEAVARFDAVRLFCERAQEVDPDFTIDADNAAVVAEICRRLDGLPLAIELAAARIDTLSPRRLLDQLQSPKRPARLALLASGAHDLPARQQTLRGAIAWSYELLDEPDRAAFRRLATCVGGFDFALADTLLADAAQTSTLDRLEALLRRSLLTREMVDGEPRFAMLETLREFAVECLVESGEADACAERHARYFLNLGEVAAIGVEGRDQRRWLDQLEREHPNLLAAVAWFVRNAPGDGLRLAADLGRFWHIRGYLQEGRHWIDALLAADRERSLPRARALLALAVLQHLHGEARAQIEEAIEIFRAAGDENGLALSRSWLAHLFQLSGEPERDRSLAEEALELARRAGHPRTLATVLDHLADIEIRDGNFDRARQCFAESIDLWRGLGDRLATGRTVTSQGNLARLQGDLDAARACFQEGLAIQREMGYPAGAVWQLSLLGNLARLRGDYAAARSALREAVSVVRDSHGDQYRIALMILFMGQLVLTEGKPEKGTYLVSAAQKMDPNLKFILDADERADLDAQLAIARDTLGAEAFTRAWSTGESLAVADAIELALG